jgi:hypothetical protein
MKNERRPDVEERRAIHDLPEGVDFGGLDEFCDKLKIIGDQCQAKIRLVQVTPSKLTRESAAQRSISQVAAA